jgi:ribosomal protein S18 acetylase RimI-like enzyme
VRALVRPGTVGVVRIRDATTADAGAIDALLATAFGYDEAHLRHLPSRLAELATDGDAVVLVAEDDDGVCGVLAARVSIVLEYAAPQMRINTIAVEPAERRRGAGRRLVAEAARIARARGCFRVELTSAHGLEAAHRFWESLDFEHTGRRYVRAVHGSG